MNDGSMSDEGAVEPRSGLSHAAIREQLGRLVASAEVGGNERIRDFLRFVVEQTLLGRTSRLKGYTIGTEVFGRTVDFDASKDPIVRIQAGRLRRSLERYYRGAGQFDPVRVTVPRGRYVPVFEAVEESARSRHDAAPPNLAIEGPSIAVLPPVDPSGSPDDTWFGVGLAEDMVVELNRYPGIKTFPCRGFSGTPQSVGGWKEFGRSVGARFFLGGSVRRDAVHLKATVYLVDSLTGRQIWSDSFREPLAATRLIETQEFVARSVVAAIADELGVVARKLSRESRGKAPENMSTYEAMLHYHHYMATLDPAAGTEAGAALEAAVAREPDFGPAWSALANLHLHAFLFGQPELVVSVPEVARLAQRGASLAPTSQLTRTIRAFACLLAGDDDGFAEEIEVALKLNPHSAYHIGTIGYLLTCHGDLDRGSMLAREAIESNPSHPKWFHHACFYQHFMRGEYAEALREIRAPGANPWDGALAALALYRSGALEEAESEMRRFLDATPALVERIDRVVAALIRHPQLAAELTASYRCVAELCAGT